MMSVEKRSAAVSAMLEASEPIRDLIKGGAHMRSLGTKYLPRFPMETEKAYKARVQGSWLFDGVGKAMDDYVDRLFDKPIESNDEGELGDWAHNIDLEGRDISNFAQDVFKASVRDGVSFIMVDAPPRPEGSITRGQAQAMNLRPYMVHLELEDILGWKVRTENNAPIVSQLRIMESVLDPDGGEFEEKKIEQIRVMDHPEGQSFVSVRLFRKTDKGEWVVWNEYQTQFPQIYLAPVYTGRTSFLMAKPPLARLAELNLAHWRSQSDQSNIMHYARVPMKVFIGWDKDDLEGAASGAGYGLVTANENAKAETLEHNGTAIDSGREELKDLEQQMQWVGLQLVMSKAAGATATGDMIDEKKSTSALARWADNLKDAIEIALGWMADIAGIDGETEVSMSRDFLSVAMNTQDMTTLVQMGLSRELLLREAKRRGLVSEDVDIEEELNRQLIDGDGNDLGE